MLHRLRVLATIACALGIATTTTAQVTTITEPSAAFVTAEDWGPQDGTFDAFTNPGYATVNNNGFTSFRGGLAFPIAAIPAGRLITRATLTIDISVYEGTRALAVHAFGGDGTLELAEFARDALIAQATVTAPTRLEFDAKAAIAAAIAAGHPSLEVIVREDPANDANYIVMFVDAAWLSVELAPMPVAHYAGAIGPGSLYEIDVPDPWNGDLVLYAHGIVEASRPVMPPSDQDGYGLMRGYLLEHGFAVAASSYSSNGWSLADAVRRTHQLGSIAASKIGQPRRTFLVGHSMGALAIVKLAERYPTQYSGVLAMCGPLGGALPELEYAGHARATFEFYFPGLLPGKMFEVPDSTVYLPPGVPGGPSELFVQVFMALLTNPGAAAQWASAAKLPYNSPAEAINSALYVVGFLLRYSTDLIDRVNGKMPFDNQLTTYEVNVSPDPAVNAMLSYALNQGVERFASQPAAVNYYDHNYTPTGEIDVPVLTLHTARDPAIPVAHENVFANAVANAGRSQWLVQRSIDRWGHCAFEPAEVAATFTDLVRWVTTGQRP